MSSERQPIEDSVGGNGVVAGESPLRRLERHIGRNVVSGFVLLVPVLVTYLILRFIFDYVDGIIRRPLSDTPLDFWGIGVVITLVILYVVGAFLSGKRLQSWQDAVLSRVPVVKGIYGVARQATDALSSSSGHHYSRVVFVEWPRPGVRTMGLVTGHLDAANNSGAPLVAVYIPTVPNPTSGMLAFFTEKDIIETNISVQDAMKTVFSGGIVLPERSQYLGLPEFSQLEEGPDR